MLARVDDNDSDKGPRQVGRERLCIVTRTVKPLDELMRFVVGPAGNVVPDIKRKLPGRGVWVTADRPTLAAAIQRKAFGRGFRREVKVDPDLVVVVDRLLERAALDALAIVYKASRVRCGFAQVEAAVAGHESLAALIHAADAQPDGVRKLAAAWRRSARDKESPTIIDLFTTAQLDLAMGRSNVVHAALLAGPTSNGFLARCRGLGRFRPEGGSGRKEGALPQRGVGAEK